jgi:hypothetical protein
LKKKSICKGVSFCIIFLFFVASIIPVVIASINVEHEDKAESAVSTVLDAVDYDIFHNASLFFKPNITKDFIFDDAVNSADSLSKGPWSMTELVSTESTEYSENPSLDIDSNGMVHITWHDFTDYGGSGFNVNIFYKYKPAGGTWSMTELVSTESTAPSLMPSLAVDNNGMVHVTWCDYTQHYQSHILYKYRYAVTTPELSCAGSLNWVNIKPGEMASGKFFVYNNGEPNSLLNWEIYSHPDWGSWTFTPNSGLGLKPEDGLVTVTVEVIAPSDSQTQFTGQIFIVNSDYTINFCIVDVALATPLNYQSRFSFFFQKLVHHFPNAFPMLQHFF